MLVKLLIKAADWLGYVSCRLHNRHRPVVERQGNRIYLRCHWCQLRTGGWAVDERRFNPHQERRQHPRRDPDGQHDRRDYDRRINERREDAVTADIVVTP